MDAICRIRARVTLKRWLGAKVLLTHMVVELAIPITLKAANIARVADVLRMDDGNVSFKVTFIATAINAIIALHLLGRLQKNKK